MIKKKFPKITKLTKKSHEYKRKDFAKIIIIKLQLQSVTILKIWIKEIKKEWNDKVLNYGAFKDFPQI